MIEIGTGTDDESVPVLSLWKEVNEVPSRSRKPRRRWLVRRRCWLCGRTHRLMRDKAYVCRTCAGRGNEGL